MRLFRFLTTGLVVNGAALVFYAVLVRFGVMPELGVWLISPLANLASYAINRFWTFGDRPDPRGGLTASFLIYLGINLAAVVSQSFLVSVLYRFLGWDPVLALGIAIILLSLVNFVAVNKLVFGSRVHPLTDNKDDIFDSTI